MMKRILFILILTAFIAGGCTKNEEFKQPVVSGLKTDKVLSQKVDSFYTTSSTVKSKTNSVVASMLMGKVTSLSVEEGDSVRKGQLLLTIDARDISNKAAAASAGVSAAQKAAAAAAQNMKMAERTYGRYKNLYDEKVITKQEFDQYTTQKNVAALEYERAKAGVAQARAGLGEAQVYQSYARVVAPVSGVITQKNIDVGSTAIQGQPLLTIEAPSDMELVANVDESYIDKVSVGEGVFIDVDGIRVKRKITKIVSSINPTTRTFKVKIDVQGIPAGKFVKIDIPVDTKNAVLVPQTSIVKKGELTGVYVVDDGNTLSYRLIRIGKSFGDSIEVLSGLTDGEKIITSDLEKAVDGAKLKE